MPQYQNTSVADKNLIVGNYSISYATAGTSSVTSFTNLGAGIVSSFGHNITKYDVQSGNAPDPIEGVANETFTISGEFIEYDGEELTKAMGGMMTRATTGATASSDNSIITAGGATTITSKAFLLKNTRIISATSSITNVFVYNATFETGLQFTAKSDNDTDPISVMGWTITGKPLTTRDTNDQLFRISHRQ